MISSVSSGPNRTEKFTNHNRCGALSGEQDCDLIALLFHEMFFARFGTAAQSRASKRVQQILDAFEPVSVSDQPHVSEADALWLMQQSEMLTKRDDPKMVSFFVENRWLVWEAVVAHIRGGEATDDTSGFGGGESTCTSTPSNGGELEEVTSHRCDGAEQENGCIAVQTRQEMLREASEGALRLITGASADEATLAACRARLRRTSASTHIWFPAAPHDVLRTVLVSPTILQDVGRWVEEITTILRDRCQRQWAPRMRKECDDRKEEGSFGTILAAACTVLEALILVLLDAAAIAVHAAVDGDAHEAIRNAAVAALTIGCRELCSLLVLTSGQEGSSPATIREAPCRHQQCKPSSMDLLYVSEEQRIAWLSHSQQCDVHGMVLYEVAAILQSTLSRSVVHSDVMGRVVVGLLAVADGGAANEKSSQVAMMMWEGIRSALTNSFFESTPPRSVGGTAVSHFLQTVLRPFLGTAGEHALMEESCSCISGPRWPGPSERGIGLAAALMGLDTATGLPSSNHVIFPPSVATTSPQRKGPSFMYADDAVKDHQGGFPQPNVSPTFLMAAPRGVDTDASYSNSEWQPVPFDVTIARVAMSWSAATLQTIRNAIDAAERLPSSPTYASSSPQRRQDDGVPRSTASSEVERQWWHYTQVIRVALQGQCIALLQNLSLDAVNSELLRGTATDVTEGAPPPVDAVLDTLHYWLRAWCASLTAEPAVKHHTLPEVSAEGHEKEVGPIFVTSTTLTGLLLTVSELTAFAVRHCASLGCGAPRYRWTNTYGTVLHDDLTLLTSVLKSPCVAPAARRHVSQLHATFVATCAALFHLVVVRCANDQPGVTAAATITTTAPPPNLDILMAGSLLNGDSNSMHSLWNGHGATLPTSKFVESALSTLQHIRSAVLGLRRSRGLTCDRGSSLADEDIDGIQVVLRLCEWRAPRAQSVTDASTAVMFTDTMTVPAVMINAPTAGVDLFARWDEHTNHSTPDAPGAVLAACNANEWDPFAALSEQRPSTRSPPRGALAGGNEVNCFTPPVRGRSGADGGSGGSTMFSPTRHAVGGVYDLFAMAPVDMN